MAGVTDVAFRILCRELGAAWTVSEMISAKGLTCMPLESRAARELLRRVPQEGPVGAQIFGHEPHIMAEAARILQDLGFAFVDINMGCPAPKIVKGGEGSALMRDPALAGRIIAAVSAAVDLPVTVKLRAGWDDTTRNAPLLARIAQENGACAITLHARTRAQFYAGRADWEIIAQVAQAVRIPVYGNGDVASAGDALNMLRQTGCAGVAVGRAAQGNPWLFREIACALAGACCAPPGLSDRVCMALRHLDMMCALYGERGAVLQMRKHVPWYMRGERGCAQLRARVNQMTAVCEVRDALTALL